MSNKKKDLNIVEFHQKLSSVENMPKIVVLKTPGLRYDTLLEVLSDPEAIKRLNSKELWNF